MKKTIKAAFLDRDGTLIFEPQDDFQIDSLEKLKILDGVIDSLKKLLKSDYKLILISNQDGIGSDSFLLEDFQIPHDRFIEILKENGVDFYREFICPHFEQDNCECRKPKIGLVKDFLNEFNLDQDNSFVCGDRESDKFFAENIGIKYIETKTNSALNLNL